MKIKTKIVALFMAVLMMVGAVACPQLFQSKETSRAEAAGTVMFSPYFAATNSYYIYYNDCSTLNIQVGTIGSDGYLDLGSIYHIAKKGECLRVQATSTSVASTSYSDKITLYRTSSSSAYYAEIASSSSTRYFAKFTALNPNTYGYGNSSNTFYGFIWSETRTGQTIRPNSTSVNWRSTRVTQADGTISSSTNPSLRFATSTEVNSGKTALYHCTISTDGKSITGSTNAPRDLTNTSYWWYFCYIGIAGTTSSGATSTLCRYGFVRTDVASIS